MAGDTRVIRVVVTGDSSSAQRALKGLHSSAKSTTSGLGGLGSAVGTWAKRGAIGLGAMTVAAGVMGMKTASTMQQARIGFTNMLGSADKADTMLKQLSDFAAKTPFEFPELVKSSQRMMAMGFAAKDVIPTLTAVGDAVAAMGGSQESIQFITRALGQMQTKGKVTGEEVRQLAEQGIPVWKILASSMGKTTGEVMKLSEQGKISASTAIPMLVKGIENGTASTKKFGGMMEAQSKTIQGRWSTLKDNAKMALASIMEKSFPLLGKVMGGISDVVENFMAVFQGKAAKGAMQWAFDFGVGLHRMYLAFNGVEGRSGIGGFFLIMQNIGKVLRVVWDWIKKLVDIYKQHMDVVNTFVLVLISLITTIKVFNVVVRVTSLLMAALSSPIVIVVGLLALLITWMVHLYRTNKDFRANVTKAWEAIQKAAQWAWDKVLKPVFGFFGSVISRLSKNFGSFKTGVKDAWTIISGAAKGAWAILSVIFNAIKLGIAAVKKGFDIAKAGIGLAWKGIKLAVGKPIEFVINTILRDGIIGKFNWLASKVGIPQIKFAGVNWKYANDGVLPGYTPGRDVHSFYSAKLGRLDLSGGEAIMRPEFTRMVGGPRGVAALNRMARGYANGGVWESISGFASGVWEAASHPYKLLSGFIGKAIQGGGWLKDIAGGLVRKVVGGFITKITTGFKDLLVGGGFAGGAESGTSGGVQRWSGLVMRALMELHQPVTLLGAVLRRISMESGGNPNAINKWDSNARAGIPSMGLMQTIGPTFLAYAGRYAGLGPYNPYANIYAGLNYALHRYGSISAIDPRFRPTGYDRGGMLPTGLSLAWNGTGRPEPVGHGLGGTEVNVYLNVEGSVVTERDLIKSVTLGVRDELIRHANRNGGRTGLPPQ